MMRTKAQVLSLVMMIVLGGCQSAQPTVAIPAAVVGSVPDRAMDANSWALAILGLEDSGEAVTPEQATKLLPLWQMLAGGGLGGDAETVSVIKQIQGTMTEPQLAAITAMDLTSEGQQAWMKEQGIEMPEGSGLGPVGDGDATDEERAAMREKSQNMTTEEREQAMADMGLQPQTDAGEGLPGDGAPPQGAAAFRGGGNVIMQTLVDLLTERATE